MCVCVCVCYQLIVSSNINMLEIPGSNLVKGIFFLMLEVDGLNPGEAIFLFVCLFLFFFFFFFFIKVQFGRGICIISAFISVMILIV